MAYEAFKEFECVNDPALCPGAGRCPRCTARYLTGECKSAHKTVSALRQTLSESEHQLNGILRDLLDGPDPDFALCRRIQSATKSLRPENKG